VSRRQLLTAFGGLWVGTDGVARAEPRMGEAAPGDGTDPVPGWGSPTPEERERGRKRLEDWIDMSGGRRRWSDLPVLRCGLDLAWPPGVAIWRPPFPSSAVRPELTAHFHRDKARLDFADPAGTRWGHDSVEAWVGTERGRSYDHIPWADRVVSVLKWYAAMPHKLLDPLVEVRVLPGAGDQLLLQFPQTHGQTGDRMMVRFADGRLIQLQHTARAFGEEVRVVAHYIDWMTVRGVRLPSEVQAEVVAPMRVRGRIRIRYLDWEVRTVSADFFEKPPDSMGLPPQSNGSPATKR